MKDIILSITVFLSGSAIMVLELMGTRILAPYFGTTIDILTSIISVVLTALSIGYWLSGKIADKKPTYKNLILILFFASLTTILLFSFIKEVLTYLIKINIDNRIAVLIGSIIFFGPVNILLGMVSPYVIRLKMNKINQSGSVSGTFYAVGTIGSIFGTVLTGFSLIPLMPVDRIVYLVGITLFITSLLLARKKIDGRIIIIFITLFILLSVIFFRTKLNNKFLLDIDSVYQHISIVDKKIKMGQQIINGRYLLLNKKGCVSGMDLRKPNSLIFPYTKYFILGRYFLPKAKNFLMIGGGGYSFPKYLLANYPDATIDVVEIDPKMTEIAKKYFYLKDSPRLHIYTEDGRVYLNKNTKKYDVILMDAFGDNLIPFPLTTKEVLIEVRNNLTTDGLVITNIISAMEGPKSLFFKSEYLTYKSIFPSVLTFPVKDKNDKKIIQNIIFVAMKNKNFTIPKSKDTNSEFEKYLNHLIKIDVEDGFILTDNYAPVENMFMK